MTDLLIDLTAPAAPTGVEGPRHPEKDPDHLTRFAALLAQGLADLAAEALAEGRVADAADLAATRANLVAEVPGADR